MSTHEIVARPSGIVHECEIAALAAELVSVHGCAVADALAIAAAKIDRVLDYAAAYDRQAAAARAAVEQTPRAPLSISQPAKDIVFDRATRDYALYLNGESVGFARTYHEGEIALDQLWHDMLTHNMTLAA